MHVHGWPVSFPDPARGPGPAGVRLAGSGFSPSPTHYVLRVNVVRPGARDVTKLAVSTGARCKTTG